MAPVKLTPFQGQRLVLVAGAVGAIGIVLSVIGLFLQPRLALCGWLIAFSWAVSIALGALIFLMIGYAAGARWPVAVRRLTESVTSTLPVLAVALVPILLGAGELYLWIRPPAHLNEHARALLAHKAPYLNQPFFAARGIFYFLLWVGIGWLLRRWSFQRDDITGAVVAPERPHHRERRLSAAMLPPVGLTLTFASFDWLMSLQPEWYSTAFGVYYFAGGFVASLGLVTTLAYLTRRSGLVAEKLTPFHFHALGRLLLAFSVFWAYIAFFQAMLIQIANRPEEVTFFIARIHGGWGITVWILIFGRFVLPFFLLLPRSLKLRPEVVAAVGAWIVATHYVDIYWLVAPAIEGHSAVPTWLDLAALAGLAGTSVACAGWCLRGKVLLPVNDPLLDEALAYRSAP